jgi:hypothetical protein
MLLKVIITLLMFSCLSIAAGLHQTINVPPPSGGSGSAEEDLCNRQVHDKLMKQLRNTLWFIGTSSLLMVIATGLAWITQYQRTAYILASVSILGAIIGRALTNEYESNFVCSSAPLTSVKAAQDTVLAATTQLPTRSQTGQPLPPLV